MFPVPCTYDIRRIRVASPVNMCICHSCRISGKKDKTYNEFWNFFRILAETTSACTSVWHKRSLNLPQTNLMLISNDAMDFWKFLIGWSIFSNISQRNNAQRYQQGYNDGFNDGRLHGSNHHFNNFDLTNHFNHINHSNYGCHWMDDDDNDLGW